jgi:hypothetical protein
MLVFNYLNLLRGNIPCLAPIRRQAPLTQFYGPTVQERCRIWKVRRNFGKVKLNPFPPDEVPALGKGFVFRRFYCFWRHLRGLAGSILSPTLRLNFEMVFLGIDFDFTIYTGKDTKHTITYRAFKGFHYIYLEKSTCLDMKNEIIRILTFCCMFVVLGLQELLHGSWHADGPETLKSRSQKSNF